MSSPLCIAGHCATRHSHNVYRVKRTIRRMQKNGNMQILDIDIGGTFTYLPTAMAAAYGALRHGGHLGDMFTTYERTKGTAKCRDGDEVFVHAVADSGETFTISLETAPNDEELRSDAWGKVQGSLYHVLATNTHYNSDHSGATTTSWIEGTFDSIRCARDAARETLFDSSVQQLDNTELCVFDSVDDDSDDSDWDSSVEAQAMIHGGDSVVISIVKGESKHQCHRVVSPVSEWLGTLSDSSSGSESDM